MKAGQNAEIKQQTFNVTRYGTLPAEVKTITANAVMQQSSVQPDHNGEAKATGGAVFPATLTLASSSILVDGKPVKLSPGMNVTAEIKTGKRKVVDFLLSSIQSHMSEIFKER